MIFVKIGPNVRQKTSLQKHASSLLESTRRHRTRGTPEPLVVNVNLSRAKKLRVRQILRNENL